MIQKRTASGSYKPPWGNLLNSRGATFITQKYGGRAKVRQGVGTDFCLLFSPIELGSCDRDSGRRPKTKKLQTPSFCEKICLRVGGSKNQMSATFFLVIFFHFFGRLVRETRTLRDPNFFLLFWTLQGLLGPVSEFLYASSFLLTACGLMPQCGICGRMSYLIFLCHFYHIFFQILICSKILM